MILDSASMNGLSKSECINRFSIARGAHQRPGSVYLVRTGFNFSQLVRHLCECCAWSCRMMQKVNQSILNSPQPVKIRKQVRDLNTRQDLSMLPPGCDFRPLILCEVEASGEPITVIRCVRLLSGLLNGTQQGNAFHPTTVDRF